VAAVVIGSENVTWITGKFDPGPVNVLPSTGWAETIVGGVPDNISRDSRVSHSKRTWRGLRSRTGVFRCRQTREKTRKKEFHCMKTTPGHHRRGGGANNLRITSTGFWEAKKALA
jgi:hypothetical protein